MGPPLQHLGRLSRRPRWTAGLLLWAYALASLLGGLHFAVEAHSICAHGQLTHGEHACATEERAASTPELDALADPLCGLCTDELRTRLERALLALPGLARLALTLRAVDGLDYAAIAERLEVPVGTVRSSLHRARAALREPLADWLG